MPRKDGWDKFKIASRGISSICLVLISIFIIHLGSKLDRDTHSVELAIDILRLYPRPYTTNLREWATDVLEKYSRVKFSKETREDLIYNEPLLPLKIEGKECEEYSRKAEELRLAGEKEGAMDYYKKVDEDCSAKVKRKEN